MRRWVLWLGLIALMALTTVAAQAEGIPVAQGVRYQLSQPRAPESPDTPKRKAPALLGALLTDPAPPRPVMIAMEGPVTAAYSELPGTIIVKETIIQVPATVLIRPDFEKPVRVGDWVLVYALREGETTTARYIRISRDYISDNPIEFRGVITDYPAAPYAGRWMVAGVSVDVAEDKAPSEPPAMGYYAHVVGYLRTDRSVEATQIRILAPEVARRFLFQGKIEAVAEIPGEWVVGGVRGRVEAATQVVGDAEVGALAEVTGYDGPDGKPIFARIEVLPAEGRYLQISGLIQDIDVYAGYGAWVVGGTTIEVDERTFVDESRARAQVGMWAEVIARPGGRYPYALRIRVERPD